LREVLSRQTEPTLVAAHSYGGAIVTGLGEDAPNVAGLVFVTAFALDEGETLQGLQATGPQLPVFNYIKPDSAGFLWMEEEGFVKYFAADVEPVKARVMFAVQQPFAGEIFGTRFGKPGWKNTPNYYLISEKDQVIPPEAQRFMAARIGANIGSVDGSHVALVSHYEVVADFIKNAAEQVGA
jgi:pimeloyl-ACP methyl ester carboxylesterase